MRFRQLVVRNFASIGKIKLDLSQPGLTLVIGDNKDKDRSNGAGKSSIFEALTWCLYDRTTKLGGKDKDSVINRHGGPCQVAVDLIDGPDKYTIARERKKGSSRVWILKNGHDIRGKNNADTTDIIQSTIGINYEEWIRGHYLPQRDQIPFGQMTDSELKRFFLQRLLDIEWVSNSWQKVHDDAFKIADELSEKQHELKAIKQKIDETKLEYSDLLSRSKSWLNKKAELLVEINNKLRSHLDEYDEIVARNKKRENDIAYLKEQIVAINPALVKERIEELLMLKGAVENVIERHHRFEELEDKVGQFCPTCGIKITVDHIVELKNQSGSDWKAKKELQEIKSQLNDAQEALQQADDYLAEIDALKPESTEILTVQIHGINENRKQMKSETNPYVQLVSQTQGRLEKAIRDCSSIEEDIVELETKYEKVEFWEVGFSRTGIQSYLLDSLTPILNERLNDTLIRLTDGEITAKFNTTMKMANDEYREKFNLEVINRIGGDSYNQMSGGEAKRIDLAAMAVMSDLVRTRTNKQLDFLCFDEPFRSLDEDGINKFLLYLKEEYVDIPVFIITHTDVDPNLFQREWKVIKVNGMTSLEV